MGEVRYRHGAVGEYIHLDRKAERKIPLGRARHAGKITL
jgi:hypothetical protein